MIVYQLGTYPSVSSQIYMESFAIKTPFTVLMSCRDLTLFYTVFTAISDNILLVTNAELCAVSEFPSISCPPSSSEAAKTVCCWVNGTATCCDPTTSFVSDSLVIMISVLVMLFCICLSVLCIVCCFWSPCPLYSVCRINYTYGDIVAYSKEEESALSLPPDESFLSNTYSPLPIKVIKVSEDP